MKGTIYELNNLNNIQSQGFVKHILYSYGWEGRDSLCDRDKAYCEFLQVSLEGLGVLMKPSSNAKVIYLWKA